MASRGPRPLVAPGLRPREKQGGPKLTKSPRPPALLFGLFDLSPHGQAHACRLHRDGSPARPDAPGDKRPKRRRLLRPSPSVHGARRRLERRAGRLGVPPTAHPFRSVSLVWRPWHSLLWLDDLIPMALDVDTSAAPSDAGRAHPRPWLRAMGRAAAVAADTNGTDHCLGPLVLHP